MVKLFQDINVLTNTFVMPVNKIANINFEQSACRIGRFNFETRTIVYDNKIKSCVKFNDSSPEGRNMYKLIDSSGDSIILMPDTKILTATGDFLRASLAGPGTAIFKVFLVNNTLQIEQKTIQSVSIIPRITEKPYFSFDVPGRVETIENIVMEMQFHNEDANVIANGFVCS